MLKYKENTNRRDENTYNENLQLLDIDDTLRSLLLKHIYRMNFNDEVLRGILGEKNASFEPGDLLGIMGSTGSGKSILIQYIIALLILPEELKGHNLKVLYLDTDIYFSIEIFVEKYLIPIIEKKIEEASSEEKKVEQIELFEKDRELFIDQVISKSLSNLNVIQVSDLLDLICIARQIKSFNYNARIIVIDSINFWNADLSSYIIGKENSTIVHNSEDLKNHVFGYYTNKNTLFNCVCSLIKHIIKYNGLIGIITINEEFISTFDKYKHHFTEELIELPNLFSINNKSDFQENNEETILIKFPNIINSKFINNYINKMFGNNLKFTNIIWISKSSFPINEKIHHNPNCSIIPSYFICINNNNQNKNFLSFNDYYGLILLS